MSFFSLFPCSFLVPVLFVFIHVNFHILWTTNLNSAGLLPLTGSCLIGWLSAIKDGNRKNILVRTAVDGEKEWCGGVNTSKEPGGDSHIKLTMDNGHPGCWYHSKIHINTHTHIFMHYQNSFFTLSFIMFLYLYFAIEYSLFSLPQTFDFFWGRGCLYGLKLNLYELTELRTWSRNKLNFWVKVSLFWFDWCNCFHQKTKTKSNPHS